MKRLTEMAYSAEVWERFYSRTTPEPNTGCYLWTSGMNGWGYGAFHYGGLVYRAHRFAWMLAGRSIPEGMLICHKCDTRACVNPDHLFMGTPGENMRDKTEKGRAHHPVGHKNGMAKLTDETVRLIRASNDIHKVLAKRYGVDQSLISLVKRQKIWAHVK